MFFTNVQIYILFVLSLTSIVRISLCLGFV